ncbi:MAG: DUF4157 domain-containing protein [Richelia sp. RM1_1_1]|nr:DUF4157 domain-containing protein [Richelia sp. RM1_1_1]
MSWERKVQKKSSWGSSAQALRESLFKTQGVSKPVEPVEKAALKPIQFRGTDTSHLDHLEVNNTNRPIVTPRVNLSNLQTKLTVGAPGDKYEQEADNMASQVMSMPDSAVQRDIAPEEQKEEEVQTKPLAVGITPLVQREEMPSEEEVQTKPLGNGTIQREEMPEEEDIQTKPISASIQREILPEDEEVQTKPSIQRATDSSFEAGGNIENQLNSSKGGGSPLPDEVRSFMEPRFGADFGQVRVHTGSEAVQMNRDLNAQAFTHGSDVYYGAGKAPGKDDLTAHELTHVMQQQSSVATNSINQLQRQENESVDMSIEHDVTLFPQPTNMTCWSAATTMLFGDRSISSGEAEIDGNGGLSSDEKNIAAFAKSHGLTLHYPQSWSVKALYRLLNNGPLAIMGAMPLAHAVVLAGMNGDGTAKNTKLYIYDPWPVNEGKIVEPIYANWINTFPLATYYILHR